MSKKNDLIFIFSLPRSGSTLLQKLLMTHPEINSVSEPWILLHFVSLFKNDLSLSKYNQNLCVSAFDDSLRKIGKNNYFSIFNNFVKKLYKEATMENGRYFLDKTPRYYLIIPEIAEIFPNAKFIFLLRNPLSIYSSILQNWTKNSFKTIHYFNIDLYKGSDLLLKGYQKFRDRSIIINYRDLVKNTDTTLHKVSRYLEIEFDRFDINKYKNQDLKGDMGDKKGIKKYSYISKKSLNKWKQTFSTFARKKIAKNYIESLNDKYFSLINLNKKELIKEINSIKIKKVGIKDLIELILSRGYEKFKSKIQTQNGMDLFKKNKDNNIFF